MSNFLRPHELQHARLPCPSLSPVVAQTHVHWVSDAIQPSHPLLSPSPLALNLSQHHGLFKWVSSLHQVVGYLRLQICKRSMSVYVESGLELKFFNESALHIRWPKYSASASVLPINIQGWFPLGLTGLVPLQSKGLSRVFSNTRKYVQCYELRP